MNPWLINPVWQNVSSMCREIAAVGDSQNEVGRYHHLSSSLSFAIATIESFLNGRMRSHLESRSDGALVQRKLRKGRFIEKLRGWPREILGTDLSLADSKIKEITSFYEIRCDLTHPKTSGHDVYETLETLNAENVKLAVAEYCVRFHEAEGSFYPYWLLGWNYFNPREDSQEIYLINNQQFLHSMTYLGFRVFGFEPLGTTWLRNNMSTFAGYLGLYKELCHLSMCEPRDDQFPYKPILCRAWWATEHQRQCGNVTQEAIERAIRIHRGKF